MKQDKIQSKSSNSPSVSNTSVVIFWIVSVGMSLFLCFGFFYWTVVPYMQSGEYIDAERTAFATGDFSGLLSDDFIFSPDSNVQGILRSDFLRTVVSQYNQGNIKTPSPLLDKAIAEMEDYTSNHPGYYTYLLGLASGYSVKGTVAKDPTYFALANKIYKQDMDLAVGRQDIVYSYATDLLRQGRSDEAISLMNVLIAQDPDTYANYYQMGQIYAYMDEKHYDESLSNFELSLGHEVNLNNDFTKQAYQRFLKYYYDKNDVVHFRTVASRLSEIDQTQKYAYLGVLDSIDKTGKIPKLDFLGGK